MTNVKFAAIAKRRIRLGLPDAPAHSVRAVHVPVAARLFHWSPHHPDSASFQISAIFFVRGEHGVAEVHQVGSSAQEAASGPFIGIIDVLRVLQAALLVPDVISARSSFPLFSLSRKTIFTHTNFYSVFVFFWIFLEFLDFK